MSSIRLMTGEEVAAALPMRACIAAVEDAFRQLGLGMATAPVTVGVPSRAGGFHIKAGILERPHRRYYAAKTNGNFPGNPARGMPTIQGVVVLCDADDGRVLAVMDSMELTARRTAAATAVAARALARTDSAVVTIVGCGFQAALQLEALLCALPLTRGYVHDIDEGRAHDFSKRMSEKHGVELSVARSVSHAVQASDVCVTCTTSREYLVHGGDVRPGTFIAGVGVDNEGKKELGPTLLSSALVVTDLTSQCAQIGDLRNAIDAAAMDEAAVHAELSAIVSSARPGRKSADEVFVFDSTGIAIQDVAAAAVAFEVVEDGAAGH